MAKKKPPRAGASTPKGKRKPATVVDADRLKRPVPAAPLSDSQATLVWRFSMIDLEGPWGWAGFAVDHVNVLHERCANWEKMREAEVFGSGGNKRIPAERLCPEAQARLLELELDDHGALWELRLSGKPRVWGLRSSHVFYPVWWDPEHSVCPSKLRHT